MSQSSEDNLNAERGAIGPAKTSEVFKKLRINPIKALYKYYTPHNINLAGGIPLESCFPFKSMKVNLDGEDENDSYTITKGDDLHLNYHMSDGIVPLKNWAKGHVQSIHSPPFAHEVTMTVGATDSWYKIIELLNTECVLFDQYVYGASVTPCNTLGKRSIGVPSDDQGIIPDALRETVRVARAQGLIVDVLYLIPVGHNPMGVTMPLERKKEIYAACQELDLIIVEDDAYYYLYYPNGDELPGSRALPRSMLSLDVDGRVIRIDTVAKIICPGIRLGWITGPPDFVTKYVLLQSQCSQFPSSISQSVMMGLVKHWGEEGLHLHLQSLQSHYRRQRDVFVNALDKFVPAGMCTYTRPTGGMFLWLTFPTLGHVTTHQLFEAFAKADVIVAPGTGFYVPGIHELLESGVVPTVNAAESGARSNTARPNAVPCVRACYAAVNAERIVQAVQAMALCVITLHEVGPAGTVGAAVVDSTTKA